MICLPFIQPPQCTTASYGGKKVLARLDLGVRLSIQRASPIEPSRATKGPGERAAVPPDAAFCLSLSVVGKVGETEIEGDRKGKWPGSVGVYVTCLVESK